MLLSKQVSGKALPVMRSLARRWYADSLLRNSVFIMTTTAVTAASGYLFWIIAARMYSAEEVGLASALIGTMTLAATLANLGVGPTLIQALPRRESGYAWSLTLNAVIVTSVTTSLLASGAAAILLPVISPRLAIVGHSSGFTLALIVGVPLLAVAALLDSTFTAERVAGNMLTRTATFALLRIPLLLAPVLLGHTNALVICAAWVLAAGTSVVAGALLIPRLKRSYRLATRGIVAQIRSMLSLVAGHQFISLGSLAPIYLLPVLVVARLSLAENAYFYTSWQVGSLFFMVSPSVAVALLAEGAHSSADIFHKARSSILLITALLCPPMLVAVLGGHLILAMFGAKYSLYGYSLLVVLVASAIPDAITNVYIVVLRVQKRLLWAALVNLGMAAITLALAWILLPALGIVGAGWAWLIAQTTGTVVVIIHALIVISRARTEVGWRRYLTSQFAQQAGALAAVTQRVASAMRTRVGEQRCDTTAGTAASRILLIVDPCSAGESLRIAPYVTMVRQSHPRAYITLVANEDALTALERVEDVDSVIKSDLYRYRPHSRALTRLEQVWAWLGLVWRLGFGYDLVITFYWGSALQHLLGYVVSRGRRVGYSNYPAPLARWLLTNNLGPFQWKQSHPPQHVALLHAAGVEATPVARPAIGYSPVDMVAVERLLRERGVADCERLILLHPGSDWACQQWLRERWSELADTLVDRYNATVVFTGIASEAEYVEDIRKRMTAPSLSLAGQTTLPGMAALLSRSLLCVCVDSAIFELTQAVGTPAVVLAGPSRPDTGVFGARKPIILRRMSDDLASKIGACQDGHNALNELGCWNYQCWMSGMREVQVADTLEAIESLIPRVMPQPVEFEMAAEQRTAIAAPHPALEELFAAFSQQDIRWLVLRGETELASPSGDDDVDLLIDPRDMPRARAILAAHQYLPLPALGRGSHRFFGAYHPATETWITLDIVTELTYGPYLNLFLPAHAATGVLSRRQQAGTFFIPAPDDGFWTLFFHCMLDKGAFAPHRAARLRELASAARTDGPLARLAALACPNDWEPARLIERVTLGEWDTLTRLAPVFRAGWRRREPIKARWRSIKNHFLRLLEIPMIRLRRPGMTVALLGPDGAGKSTLATAIERSFPVPVRSVYMGLWKSGRTSLEAESDPPGMWVIRRGFEISGRLPKAWGRYLVGAYHQALGQVVIFDRYVYDALVSARQSPDRLKRVYMWVLGHSCPVPDLVLVLDAPGEVMFARKGEDSPEELEAQRQGLLALRDHVPHVQIVDVTREEAAVRADVLNRIWSAYHSRWRAN